MNDPHSHRAPEEAVPPWPSRIKRAFGARYSSYGEHGVVWRMLTPAVFVLAGGLFVTSAISSGGTDLRPGRYDNLADLAKSRSDRYSQLNHERSRLQDEVDRLTAQLTSPALQEAKAKVDALRGPAGLLGVHGPGVTITLDDAPDRQLADSSQIARTLVHQQDIQAVVNALWAGSAEAVTVQGVRIVSTTGIKCVGNSVLLQGVAYPPPYVISAIGDNTRMMSRVDSDPLILQYLDDVQTYGLGWSVDVSDNLTFPKYDGSVDTQYARPLTTGSASP